MSHPLRRSLLYVPASAEAMVRKAGGRGADVLIIDLEDGVHPELKDAARAGLAPLLGAVDFGGAEVLLRVNSLGTPWHAADLAAVRALPVHGAVVPKVASAATVTAVDAALDGSVALFLMIETVAGVLAAREIAAASPRVTGLLFGAADYRESLRAQRLADEAELAFARSQILHAARAAGADAFDTPWFAYRDAAGLEASARRVRELGFDGKTAIHPAQVAVINEVFAPTPAELERARAVIAALARAAVEGRGVATVAGEMVETLHRHEAERTLERAQRLGLL